MFISDFAIRKPLITVVSMVTLVVFGLFALLKLKTDEFPEGAPPVVTAGNPYPGAPPAGAQKEIVEPTAEQTSPIRGAKYAYGHAHDAYHFVRHACQLGTR